MCIAVFGVAMMLAVGMVAYGVEVEMDRVLPALVTFVVGSASFAMLGLALAAVAPSGQSSPALAQATMRPGGCWWRATSCRSRPS